MSENRPTKIEAMAVVARTGSLYPAPFHEPVAGRVKRALGNALGLNQFGVNLVTLAPGAGSSQRHWHENEDEFVYILEGTATLVTNDGESTLEAGMAAGFPAGLPDGHHLVNRSDAPVVYLEVGTRAPEETAHYSDIDMKARRDGSGGFAFTRKDGTSIS